MRRFYCTQRAENGGYPVENGGMFKHGENLVILDTREFYSMLHRCRQIVESQNTEHHNAMSGNLPATVMAELDEHLACDTYVERGFVKGAAWLPEVNPAAPKSKPAKRRK